MESPDVTPSTITLWLLEDDSRYRQSLEFVLNNTTGMRCTRTFGDGEALLRAVSPAANEHPDVLLLDINLPGQTSLALLPQIKTALPDTALVMLTIRDDSASIFEALRRGASGYLLKNVRIDQLTQAIRQAHTGAMLIPAPVAQKVQQFFADHTPKETYGLTPRETEVLQHMAEGRSQKMIADALCISVATVNTHVKNLYAKLHVNSGIEAVAKALRERLI